MINRIKDKQTGEYHDIGGLKCKLVAEGVLEYDTNSDLYNGTYKYEQGKWYAIIITFVDYIEYYSIGLGRNGDMNTIPAADGGDALIIIKTSENESSIMVLPSVDSIENMYNGYNYKVYELPFALEV